MTEEQKYHGSSYKNKNKKVKITTGTPTKSTMSHSAYVEDVPEGYDDGWADYDVDSESIAHLPEAPTPPNADDNVNVFDFLVTGGTPTASNLSLPRTSALDHGSTLVRWDHNANAYLDPMGQVVDHDNSIQYGTGPIPVAAYRTPHAKSERKKQKSSTKDGAKKRKRLHVDILERDQDMTDAPPVLHSGLTGGLNRLMNRPAVFPPSPDYSGGDAAETPASPLKKSRHSKHSKISRTEAIGSSLMALLSSNTNSKAKSKVKSKKRKTIGSTATKKRHHHRPLEAPSEVKMLEYRPNSSASGDEGKSGQAMVLYRPRAELFMSFVSKGPESERGYSMNKALKRFHRERSASTSGLSKSKEEKELWRSLRLKRNERGEIVLFCVDEED
jgi:cell growth-regulating nucleolar protein